MDDGFRGLTLWNTMKRAKEEFRPLDWQDPGKAEADRHVRMYVCGPTVYDYAHIGNARPVIVFDLLYRLLRHLYGADHVTYVRNITDVDDKINRRAARDYPDLPLNAAIAKVTQATADQFHADVAALGCLAPDHEPRATDFVTGRSDGHDMVSMIATLIEKGHAYEAGGEVLFDVTSMADYGQLSNATSAIRGTSSCGSCRRGGSLAGRRPGAARPGRPRAAPARLRAVPAGISSARR